MCICRHIPRAFYHTKSYCLSCFHMIIPHPHEIITLNPTSGTSFMKRRRSWKWVFGSLWVSTFVSACWMWELNSGIYLFLFFYLSLGLVLLNLVLLILPLCLTVCRLLNKCPNTHKITIILTVHSLKPRSLLSSSLYLFVCHSDCFTHLLRFESLSSSFLKIEQIADTKLEHTLCLQ